MTCVRLWWQSGLELPMLSAHTVDETDLPALQEAALGLSATCEPLSKSAPPESWCRVLHARKHARKVTLIRKPASQGDLGEFEVAFPQQ